MKSHHPLSTLLLSLLLSLIVSSELVSQASTSEQTADSIARVAIAMMDEGKLDESIEKLNEAKSIFAKDAYDYEIGLAYYQKEDFATAKKVFQKLVKSGEPAGIYYKMLGNCYDILGDAKKAEKTYLAGIDKFPNSGSIYLELGVLKANQEKWVEALAVWEKGLTLDPQHASNYYHLSKLFSRTDEKMWGLLYAELFLNLEFNTARAEEIASFLFDLYFDVYQATSDTSGTISLTKKGMEVVLDVSQIEKMKEGDFRLLKFSGQFAIEYAKVSPLYLSNLRTISALTTIRETFVDSWFVNERNTELYPHVLLTYLKEIKDNGYFEAYNYYLFRSVLPDDFGLYLEINQAKFEQFLSWYNEHDLDFVNYPHSRLDVDAN